MAILPKHQEKTNNHTCLKIFLQVKYLMWRNTVVAKKKKIVGKKSNIFAGIRQEVIIEEVAKIYEKPHGVHTKL